MPPFKGVVFDLDDTLYLERDYVRSGFRHVATEVARLCDLSEESTFSFLWNQFVNGFRGNVFDLLQEKYEEVHQHFDKASLINLYRSHSPVIEMPNAVRRLLSLLQVRGCQTAIISDGDAARQQAKVAALSLNKLFDPIILTDTWGSAFWKPHPRGYLAVMDAWQLKPADFVFIADNPAKDFVTPKRLRWTTIRLRVPGQLHFEIEPQSQDLAPEIEVRSYDELSNLLLLKSDVARN